MDEIDIVLSVRFTVGKPLSRLLEKGEVGGGPLGCMERAAVCADDI